MFRCIHRIICIGFLTFSFGGLQLDTDKGQIQANLQMGTEKSTVFVLLLENDETWHVFDAAYNHGDETMGLVKVPSFISKPHNCDSKCVQDGQTWINAHVLVTVPDTLSRLARGFLCIHSVVSSEWETFSREAGLATTRTPTYTDG